MELNGSSAFVTVWLVSRNDGSHTQPPSVNLSCEVVVPGYHTSYLLFLKGLAPVAFCNVFVAPSPAEVHAALLVLQTET